MRKTKTDAIIQSIKSINDKNVNAIPALLSVDINGNMLIEAAVKIIQSSENEISLRRPGKKIYIYGNSLKIMSFTKASVAVSGVIDKIQFAEVE